MPAHSALTGADLHEPKGVEAAGTDTVYVADGVGSGAWEKITDDSIDSASIFNTNKHHIVVWLEDVSTADAIHVPFSFDGQVDKITSVLEGAITVADATITVTDNGGNSMGTITIAYSGSAEGDIDTLTPTVNNTFTAGQRIKIATNGGSTDTQRIVFMIDVTQTGA